MARLFIFIPFQESKVNKQEDLPPQAIKFSEEFKKLANKTIGENIGAEIRDGIDVVYSDSRFIVSNADYIIVFAHGSPRTSDKLFLNTPDLETSTTTVINELVARQANNAQKILFMCCYSGLPGHIAVNWKSQHTGQTVYAGDAAISNLYAATRTQIRTCCAALFRI